MDKTFLSLILISVIFFAPVAKSESNGGSNFGLDLSGSGLLDYRSVELSSGKNADFSGGGYGFTICPLIQMNFISFGLMYTYSVINLSNPTVVNDSNESMSSTDTVIGLRVFLRRFMLGVGLLNSNSTLKTTGSQSTNVTYTGSGQHYDLGYKFLLADFLFFMPRFYASSSKIKKSTDTDANSLNQQNYGMALDIGLSF